MTILRPSTTVSLVMWLACLIDATGILYFALMPESVSPLPTVWMMAAPFEGIFAAPLEEGFVGATAAVEAGSAGEPGFTAVTDEDSS